jgi:hypothetical protein
VPGRPCLGYAGKSCSNIAKRGPRCDACESQHQQQRNARRPHYRGAWPRISQAARAHHLATIGPICPGWKREPHQVDPTTLTTDHVTPRSLAGGVQVICKSCNAARRDRAAEQHDTNTRSADHDKLVTVATLDVDGQHVDIKRKRSLTRA